MALIDLQSVLACLRVSFRNPELLAYALLDKGSDSSEPPAKYRRHILAYRGDKVIDLVVADFLGEQFAEEFELFSFWRSTIARNSAFADALTETDVLQFLPKKPSRKSRSDIHHLGTLYEAIVGAIYIDGGIGAAETYLAYGFMPRVRSIIANVWQSNPVLQLATICQKTLHLNPKFTRIKVHGAAVHVRVTIGQRLILDGEGKDYAEAKRAAALRALQRLGMKLPE